MVGTTRHALEQQTNQGRLLVPWLVRLRRPLRPRHDPAPRLATRPAPAITGSRIGAASTGALAAVGEVQHWLGYLLIGTLMAIKFDWIYWWAGKLWGRGILDVQAQNSKRSARNIARVEKWALKLGWLGIFLAYVPIPLPIAFVVFVLMGMTGMPLWKFMVLDFISKTLWSLGYFALGWWIGEPVVYVLEQYAKVANWIAIGLIVVIMFGAFRRQAKKA